MKKSSSALIILLLAVSFLSACSDNSKRDDELFGMLSEGIENSTNSINVSTAQILQSFQDKLYDPATVEKAKIWLPATNLITTYTADLFTYLKKLKRKEILDKEEAKELYSKLAQYKVHILAIDSSIWYAFEKYLTLTTRSFDTTANQVDNFYMTFFKGISHEACLAVLNSFQNNIKIIENNVLVFCFQKTAVTTTGNNFFAALAVPNSSLFKPGERLEITAGVGDFAIWAKPDIIIDGKKQELNESGYVIYKIQVPKNPGKYSVPVDITYTDQNGIKQTVSKTIEYAVIKVCDQ